MTVYEIIHRKRDGAELGADEIAAVIRGYTAGQIPHEQMAALLMAIFFRGMSGAELKVWTAEMIASGSVLDLSSVPGVKVDKHSTGGVGDKVSLPLAPLVAACGVPVPMISGRSLGHTGGTLDKLESIPGFRTALPEPEIVAVLKRLNVCFAAATERIAPADRKLYALRDATATVESIPLIASSILSKKVAEGTDALVLDVKVGRGAFMTSLEPARHLARTLLELAADLGLRCSARLTAMDQPLGRAVGNALEVAESLAVLRGEGPPDVEELTVELGAEMLVLGGAVPDLPGGRDRIRRALSSGEGLARFRAVVEAQGGDPRAVDNPRRLPAAPEVVEVKAERSGFVHSLDAREVGLAALELGAGRDQKEDVIDPAVGFVLERKEGDAVAAGDVLARAHVRVRDAAPLLRLAAAYRIEDRPPSVRPLVRETLP